MQTSTGFPSEPKSCPFPKGPDGLCDMHRARWKLELETNKEVYAIPRPYYDPYPEAIERSKPSSRAPWCIRCREKMRAKGKNSEGNPTFRCPMCAAACSTHSRLLGARVNKGLLLQAAEMLKQGHGLSSVATKLWLSPRTVHEVINKNNITVPKCACGWPLLHERNCRTGRRKILVQ